MRKLLIVGMITGTLFFAGCGGNDKIYTYQSSTSSTSTIGIPNDVLREFYDMYPSADNVYWNVDDGLYEADFEMGDNDMSASFTPDGRLVEVNG